MEYKSFDNNLDIARLIFASSVVFLHIYNLTDEYNNSQVLYYLKTIGGLGVPAFFIVSGFVIYFAWERNPDIRKYIISRVLRLYPAYLVCVLVMVAFGLIYSLDMKVYEITRYLIYNSIFLNFLQPQFGGVFSQNIYDAFNGALWTLKVEVAFYTVLPVIAYLWRKLGVVVPVIIYLLSAILREHYSVISDVISFNLQPFENQLPFQMVYFITGMLIYKYYDFVFSNKTIFLLLSVLFLYLELSFLYPLILGFGIIYIFVHIFSKRIKVLDISYGVYIFHFPLIQYFVLFQYDKSLSVLWFTTAVIFPLILVSYLSAKYLEMPALRLKKKFQRG